MAESTRRSGNVGKLRPVKIVVLLVGCIVCLFVCLFVLLRHGGNETGKTGCKHVFCKLVISCNY